MTSFTRPDAGRQILTVTQLNRAAKDLLETYLPMLWIEGEMSNLSIPSSGHWYFTLKDNKAQVRCAMFRGRNMSVRFKPEVGQKVLLRARVSLYEGRGDFQLIAEHMEPAGLGELQRQFELRKLQFQAEGLCDLSRKKPLPAWPQRLGVITSPTGAAVHDILNVLKRRFPALPVLVLPVAVQGSEAAAQIAQAIALANQQNLCDVLIVGRGGGSLEDLWAFNEEVVARAICASHIPVVSAVGHEVDFTIADFVADARAPTPSAAAELVSPDQLELQQTLAQHMKTLRRDMQQRLRWARQTLEHARARLQHPGQILASQAQALDRLELRLKRAMDNRLEHHKAALHVHQNRLAQTNPRKRLQQQLYAVDQAWQRLNRASESQSERRAARLGKIAQLLNSVSPLNTLQRGYAIVIDERGHAVRSASQVNVGDQVTARLMEGQLLCQVKDAQTSS